MTDFSENESNAFQDSHAGYPAKPVLVERSKNVIIRSLISLFIYALLFYVMFNGDIIYIASILLVIIVHELGHLVFMRLFDYGNLKIFIVPILGALVNGKKQIISQSKLVIILLAGPVPGILIGTILYFLNRELQNDTIKMLSLSFLFINLLNCLPFYPLDGGRLMEVLFSKQGYYLRLIFGVLSIIVLAFMFLSVPIMLIVPALIGLELYNESKHHKIKDYLKNEKVNYHTDFTGLSNRDYWLIRDCILFSFPKKYVGVKPGVHQYSIAESLLIQHINSLLQVRLNLNLGVGGLITVLVFYLAIFIVPLIFLLNQLR
jgi:stage IV sporulation protein FB